MDQNEMVRHQGNGQEEHDRHKDLMLPPFQLPQTDHSGFYARDDASIEPEKASFHRMIDGFIAASTRFPPVDEASVEPNSVFVRQDQLHQYMQQTMIPKRPMHSTTGSARSIVAQQNQLVEPSFLVPNQSFITNTNYISMNERNAVAGNATHKPNERLTSMLQAKTTFVSTPTEQQQHSSTHPIVQRSLHPPLQQNQLIEQQMHYLSPSKLLYQPTDASCLSQYQCIVRQQIELFAANESDVHDVGPSRVGTIVLGQVGVRCRSCAHVPPNERDRGSTAYPTRLNVLYQAAQNIAKFHLEGHCRYISPQLRETLQLLRKQKLPSGRGKQYWAESAQRLGVIEHDGGLVFVRETNP